MKRTLCLFCALILAVGICFSAPVTITASAAFTLESGEENQEDAIYKDSETGLKFKITDTEDKTVEVCGYDSSPTNLEIPATVTINENEYSVTTIGNIAFWDCSTLTSVTIPDSVTTIGDNAFRGCTSLVSVTIGGSVTTIGICAFSNCRLLKTIEIPDSVTTIGESVFSGCTKLTSVTIGGSVTTIGDYAFNGCTSLVSVTIGESVTTIGICAFSNCSLLKTIEIPDSVTIIGNSAFFGCAKLTSIKIPESVTTIGSSAFWGCSELASITIPESVTTIGESAFYGCSELAFVTIGKGVTEIGICAFSNCSLLKTIEIPDSVTTIGESAFYGCSELASITIPASVTTIGSGAFYRCNALATVNVPCSWAETPKYTEFADGVLKIPPHSNYVNGKCDACLKICSPHMTTGESNICTVCGGAVGACGASTNDGGESSVEWLYDSVSKTLTISGSGDMANFDSRDMLSPWANYRDSIKNVVISDGVTSIGNCAFYNCTALESIEIPAGVTIIGNSAFSGCAKLTSIKIPESVTTIGSNAFRGCSALNLVEIPKNVTTIGEAAFVKCSALTSINVATDNTSYSSENDVLFNKDKTTLICYPQNKAGESYSIPENVVTIGGYAFNGCAKLKTINFPAGLKEIGVMAFYDCTALETITIPDGVTEIGAFAFYNCESIKSLKVPGSVQVFDEYSLSGYSEDLVLTVDFGHSAYDYAKRQNIKFIINGYTEAETEQIKKLEVVKHVDPAGNYLGYIVSDCDPSIAGKLVIPSWYNGKSVVEISDTAFDDCSLLTEITIPTGIFFRRATFENCKKLKYVFYVGTEADFKRACGQELNKDITVHYNSTGHTIEFAAKENAHTHCSVCELVMSSEHSFTSKVTTEPTCTKSGVKTFSCECGYTYTEEMGSLGHDIVIDKAVEATCTTTGLTEGKHCSRCGGVIIKQNVVSTTDHDWSNKDGICGGCGKTCAHTGTPVSNDDDTHSFICSVCGKVITESHDFENDDHQCDCGKLETYSITCTETGSNGGEVRLTNTEPATHGQTYTTRLLMPQDIQGWYTDVIKVSVNGVELVKGTDYTYNLQTVTLTVNGDKVTGNIEITYKINAKVTFVLNGGDLESSLKAWLATGDLYIIDDKITMPLAYGVRSSFDDLNNTFIREGYICTGLKNGEQDADMTAPVVNCTLSVQWQCTHNTIENGVCTTCGGNYCGADKTEAKVVWFYDEDTATLTITGSGAMADYGLNNTPWGNYKSSITQINIENGVTTIGANAFRTCEKLTEIIIPKSVTSIDAEAFFECSNLKYIFFEGTEAAQKTIGDALVTNAKIHYGSSTHTFEENYTVDVEPTCTEKGRESQHCKYCEKTQNEREIPCLIPGEIEAELDNSNSFSATVEDVNSITAKLKLTDEEKELISNGADMKIVFKLSDIGSAVNTAEKEAILNALTKGKIGTFLDIQLVKQIGGMSTNVENLSGLISVSVELPAELINNAVNVKRSYSVLRYHDGDEQKVTTLNSRYDEATNTLTFDTDRFSTYAIVYSDVIVSSGEGVPGTPAPDNGAVGAPETPKDETTSGTPEAPKDDEVVVENDKNNTSTDNTTSEDGTSKDDVPKAGVISTTSIWLGAMAISGFGALLVSKKKKED